MFDKYSEVKEEAWKNLRIRLGRESQAGTELAKKSFKYRASQHWNMLPLEIKEAKKIEEFKFMLKKLKTLKVSSREHLK